MNNDTNDDQIKKETPEKPPGIKPEDVQVPAAAPNENNNEGPTEQGRGEGGLLSHLINDFLHQLSNSDNDPQDPEDDGFHIIIVLQDSNPAASNSSRKHGNVKKSRKRTRDSSRDSSWDSQSSEASERSYESGHRHRHDKKKPKKESRKHKKNNNRSHR